MHLIPVYYQFKLSQSLETWKRIENILDYMMLEDGYYFHTTVVKHESGGYLGNQTQNKGG